MSFYTFSLRVETQMGDKVCLVGSIPSLGAWNPAGAVELRTDGKNYPIWESPAMALEAYLGGEVEYKYVILCSDGRVQWELEGSSSNRRVPVQLGRLHVYDGNFNALPSEPYAVFDPPLPQKLQAPEGPLGRTVAVLGSSVAAGCNAWALQGWAYELAAALRKRFGHSLVNLSESGSNVARAIERFPEVVAPLKPDFVVISLSLGNEGLFHCPPHDRNAAYARFLSGIDRLVSMVTAMGAQAVVGEVYPNGDCDPDAHMYFVRLAREHFARYPRRIAWFDALADDRGRWRPGLAADHAHPNARGHRVMFESIDLEHFRPEASAKEAPGPGQAARTELVPGLSLLTTVGEDGAITELVLRSELDEPVRLHPGWSELQSALQSARPTVSAGLYLVDEDCTKLLPWHSLDFASDGSLLSGVELPPRWAAVLRPHKELFCPSLSEVFFYDGNLAVVRQKGQGEGGQATVRVTNESQQEYNVQPMWREASQALRALPEGIYRASVNPDAPPAFGTLIVGPSGLQSRVKVPARSSMLFRRVASLAGFRRIALVPVGARCSARMLLHHLQLDGPCYPFDLTRCSSLADAADIVATDFSDMWNPDLLHYDSELGRVLHRRWSGLSFAHEVEEGDDPVGQAGVVFERMRSRYSKRAQRFSYVMRNAPAVVLVRIGAASRGEVEDLMAKIRLKYGVKDLRLIIVSRQDGREFSNLEGVVHFDHEMDPDRMNDDPGYRQHCVHLFREQLERLHVDSNNLYWCPESPESDGLKKVSSGIMNAEVRQLVSVSSEAQLQRLYAIQVEDFSP